MDRDIFFENIPEEIIVKEISNSYCYWYPIKHKSKWQINDKKYFYLKKYLINFYKIFPNHFLNWNEKKILPISIDYLKFVCSSCNCCGTLYEVPEFNGEILIKDQKYKYQGYISGKRWCEGDNNKKISDNEILNKIKSSNFFIRLLILDGPILIVNQCIDLKNFDIIIKNYK